MGADDGRRSGDPARRLREFDECSWLLQTAPDGVLVPTQPLMAASGSSYQSFVRSTESSDGTPPASSRSNQSSAGRPRNAASKTRAAPASHDGRLTPLTALRRARWSGVMPATHIQISAVS